jgi:hypothetical protein
MARALDRFDEAPRRGRDAAHALQEVLATRSAVRSPARLRKERSGATDDLRAGRRGSLPREVAVEQGTRAGRLAAHDALGLGDELAPRVRAGGDGRLGGDIGPADVLRIATRSRSSRSALESVTRSRQLEHAQQAFRREPHLFSKHDLRLLVAQAEVELLERAGAS